MSFSHLSLFLSTQVPADVPQVMLVDSQGLVDVEEPLTSGDSQFKNLRNYNGSQFNGITHYSGFWVITKFSFNKRIIFTIRKYGPQVPKYGR